MLKIRLQRVGRKNDPSFRIVLVDSHEGPKTGNHIETLGAYNPKTEERQMNNERITYWMGKGAQVSPTLWNMLVATGVVSGKKINVLPRKSPIQKEEEGGKQEEPEKQRQEADTTEEKKEETTTETPAPLEETTPQESAQERPAVSEEPTEQPTEVKE